jgi:DNA-binding winged helix-turn-helix (wHTH) protein
MEDAHDHQFGHFRLDALDQRLWRGKDELVLRPKTFAVLSHLVKHAGRLVSRDELLEAVWPGIVVSEAVLTVCIGEIRQALGDDSREARYVETAHRRGYRFIATVTSSTPFVPAPETPRAGARSVVGREAALGHRDRCLEAARRGARAVAFVTGEAGIGKTSLVDAFPHKTWPLAREILHRVTRTNQAAFERSSERSC